MKAGINRPVLADFEARALLPYLARCVLIVAFLKKSILSNVLGMPSSYF